jgi:hypothetical protein
VVPFAGVRSAVWDGAALGALAAAADFAPLSDLAVASNGDVCADKESYDPATVGLQVTTIAGVTAPMGWSMVSARRRDSRTFRDCPAPTGDLCRRHVKSDDSQNPAR